MKRGISLLEVLVAMFVVLIGLLGVASLFPVGSYQAQKGDNYERAAALADEAFSDLATRGLLNPAKWQYAAQFPKQNLLTLSPIVVDPATGSWNVTPSLGPGHIFVIDPLGSLNVADAYFPVGAQQHPWQTPTQTCAALTGQGWPIRRVTFPGVVPNINMPAEVAETIFRLRDDVTNDDPQADHPGVQKWRTDPKNGVPIARSYAGNYSWIATISPTSLPNRDAMLPQDVRYGSEAYDVSVVIFFKRDVTHEAALLDAQLNQGGQLAVSASTPDLLEAGLKDMRPGNFLALVGVHPQKGHCLLQWQRILSLDADTGLITIDDPEWPAEQTTTSQSASIYPITAIKALMLPDVIGVETHQVRLPQ